MKNNRKDSEFLCFHGGAVEVLVLLECCTVSWSDWFPITVALHHITVRAKTSVEKCLLNFGICKRNFCLTLYCFHMPGDYGCETQSLT